MNVKPSVFTTEKLTKNDIEAAMLVLAESWLDTYVNKDLGVTPEWIKAYNKERLSPEKAAERQKRFYATHTAGWIARDSEGNIIGVAMPYYDNEGLQHVGSLYVAKKWHGKGVGRALMEQIIEWFDAGKPIELGVATYNERAKAFYRKWGFKELPGSERLFAGKIPEIRMIRR